MPEFGDCIGVESGVDLKSDVGEAQPRRSERYVHRRRRSGAASKEIPPPISWLAQTENQQSTHMPWVMKKYSSEDGRLIIKEEKVQHHEFFLADRSNGRLKLNLVHLDDDDCNCKECDANDEIGVDGSDSGGEEINGGDEEIDDPTREKVSPECCRYNIGMGVNPCGGFVATAAAVFRPPLHT